MTQEQLVDSAEREIAEKIRELVKSLLDRGDSRAQIIAVLAGSLVGMLHGGPGFNGQQTIDQPLKVIAKVAFDARVAEQTRPVN